VGLVPSDGGNEHTLVAAGGYPLKFYLIWVSRRVNPKKKI